MKKLLLSTAAALALLGTVGPAKANVVTASSSPFTITDDVTAAITGGPSDLIAAVTFSNFAFTNVGTTSTTFTTTLTIANNTNALLFPSGRITALGFNVTPDATGVTDSSSVFTAFLSSNFPSFNTVDICTSTGPTCAGGGGGDLAPGASNTFTLTLTGLPFGTTSIDLGANTAGQPETFDFKWQTGIGSFESSCTFGGSCGTVPVPEPASLALFGTGLMGLGLLARRRSKKHAA